MEFNPPVLQRHSKLRVTMEVTYAGLCDNVSKPSDGYTKLDLELKHAVVPSDRDYCVLHLHYGYRSSSPCEILSEAK